MRKSEILWKSSEVSDPPYVREVVIKLAASEAARAARKSSKLNKVVENVCEHWQNQKQKSARAEWCQGQAASTCNLLAMTLLAACTAKHSKYKVVVKSSAHIRGLPREAALAASSRRDPDPEILPNPGQLRSKPTYPRILALHYSQRHARRL